MTTALALVKRTAVEQQRKAALAIRDAWQFEDGRLRRRDVEPLIDGVSSDVEAVLIWLQEIREHRSANTYRSYSKEIYRLLAWCAFVRRAPISDLMDGDYRRYKAFLMQPPAHWCQGGAGVEGSGWTPLRGGLSASAAEHALAVIGSLLKYLTGKLYLSCNVFNGSVALKKSEVETDMRADDRSLPRIAMEAIEKVLGREWPQDEGNIERLRARVVIGMLLQMALRRTEVAEAIAGELVLDASDGYWRWKGRRKGSKQGNVTVTHETMKAITAYREAMGLKRYPEPDDISPLVLTLNGSHGVSGQTVANIFERVASMAAADLEAGFVSEDSQEGALRRAAAAKLREATPHWLRHTRATQLLESGATIAQVADILQHASPDVTASVYVHSRDKHQQIPGFNSSY